MNKERIRSRIARHARHLVTACLIAVVLTSPLVIRADSDSTAQALKAAKAERDRYAQSLAQAQAQVSALQGQSNRLSSDLAWIRSRSEAQRQVCAKLLDQKNAAIQVMADATEAYVQAVETLEKKKLQYAERIRIMFMHSGDTELETFLKSDSLQSFLTTTEFMKMIADSDEQIIDDLIAAEREAKHRKIDAEKAKSEMDRLVNEANAALAELKQNEAMTAARLNKLEASLSISKQRSVALAADAASVSRRISTLSAQYKTQLDKEKAAAAAAAAAAANANASGGSSSGGSSSGGSSSGGSSSGGGQTPPRPSPPSSSGLIWPIPGCYTITSGFGSRLLGGVWNFHGGIDIAASVGTSVVAAQSGVVVSVGGHWTYGNTVLIVHPNGMATRYAHLSSILVSSGQSVSRGQVIARSGNTGNSTGPHLHFEVIVDGIRRNPLNYVSR